MPPPTGRRPQSVLFMCAQNAVRSPMAEGLAKHFFGRSLYVQSAGVRTSEPDRFMVSVMTRWASTPAGTGRAP